MTGRFRIKKKVRQRCSLHALFFLIYLDDVERRWVKKNEQGTVIGKVKVFCLKFTDDIMTIVDSAERLKSILRDLRTFNKETGLNVNKQKTKLIVFRKGEKIGKK